jgi:hypothetical protein
MSVPRGWDASERVLASGGFASRQSVLVDTPVVPTTADGAARLGQLYWRAVGGATRGAVRAGWTAEGGRLRLLGVVTLLRFGPARLTADDGSVTCRYTIEGGLLALRPGGSVTMEQRPAERGYELSVRVEEYVPRLAARSGAPRWSGLLYARAQSPFHAAVSRRYFTILLAEAAP